MIQASGFPGDVVQVNDSDGVVSATMFGQTATLTEVQPGFFLASTGDTFDFRGTQARFLNISVLKITPQARIWHLVLYMLCGLVFLVMLLFWPIRALVSAIRRKKAMAAPAVQTKGIVWLTPTAGLMVLASLTSLVCLVVVVIVPNMIYLPWPHPCAELNLWQHLLLYLPYISLAVALIAALLAGMAYLRHGLTLFLRAYFTVCVLATLAFNAVLLI
jgi:hypothetical protein